MTNHHLIAQENTCAACGATVPPFAGIILPGDVPSCLKCYHACRVAIDLPAFLPPYIEAVARAVADIYRVNHAPSVGGGYEEEDEEEEG